MKTRGKACTSSGTVQSGLPPSFVPSLRESGVENALDTELGPETDETPPHHTMRTVAAVTRTKMT
jgi:hypothetical protein